MREVGFPPGVVNVVTSADARARGRRSPRRATSTWSPSPAPPSSARRIFEAGGNTMKRLLLELGGKGAAVVFDDADLDVAVTAHRQRVGVPLRPDLHRADARDRAPQPLRRAGRPARGDGRRAEGRRPAVGGHDRRPGDLGRPARPHRGATSARASTKAPTWWSTGASPATSTAASTSRPRCSPSAPPT